jgi:hypothetical protein
MTKNRLYAAIAGACFIGITQLATREHLYTSHIFSLCCFAASLPLMALRGVGGTFEDIEKDSWLWRLIDVLTDGFLLLFWFGVVALLFSFGWVVALFFMAASLIAFAILQVSGRWRTTAKKPKTVRGHVPFGIPVPGKANLVESPFTPGRYIDIAGFAPGAEVRDPYTDKIFRVPEPRM